ncbi:ribosome association toxin RatA [mine drainage metagenome]|uniref:Ribosome association toxin RatA n=1 Tax=mine drainage metagenome TaxID=410659 RepID=A0A1J5Q1A6_9ZZZZ
MPKVHKSVLIWYSPQEMYDLVTDVEAYPQFLPWCGGATVEAEEGDTVRATVVIDFKGIRQSFTTRNTNLPGREVQMRLVEGPFSDLQGRWVFNPLADGKACKVEFLLDYRFSNFLVEKVIGPVFNHIASSFVDAFVHRAKAVYGPR